MPAEWELHEATWLAWPHNPEDWPGKFQSIPWLYAEIVRLLAARERVHLIVENASALQRVTSMLRRTGANLDQVIFHAWPTDRGWTRDSGPIFIRNAEGSVALTNWRFNAWAKYSDWHLDDKLPDRVAKLLGVPAWAPLVQNENGTKYHCVLEGGSIDVNGAGSLLTTEECHLSEVQQRNPGVSRAQLERVFHDYLAIDQTIWLNRGIVGDDTHGHIDDIARFVAPTTIIAAVEPDTRDPTTPPSQKTSRASNPRVLLRANSSPSSSCPCLAPSSFAASASQPATPTSTSPTASSLYPPSTIPTTAWRSTLSPNSSPAAKSSASIQST
jgi:agmatine deiminase